MAAHRIDGGDPALLAQRTPRLGELAAIDDLGGAQALEVVRFAGAAGGGDDPVTQAGEQGDGEVPIAMAWRGLKAAGSGISQSPFRRAFCARPPQWVSPTPQPLSSTESPTW
ncbi:hypothetical protein D3C76_1490400 [compost metagenome]